MYGKVTTFPDMAHKKVFWKGGGNVSPQAGKELVFGFGSFFFFFPTPFLPDQGWRPWPEKIGRSGRFSQRVAGSLLGGTEEKKSSVSGNIAWVITDKWIRTDTWGKKKENSCYF